MKESDSLSNTRLGKPHTDARMPCKLRRRRIWTVTAVSGIALAALFVIYRAAMAPSTTLLRLPDATEVRVARGSSLTVAPDFTHARTVRAHGEMIFRVPKKATSLTVQTRLLRLTASGSTTLVISAFDDEAGEQFAVLEGHVHCIRAYQSEFDDVHEVSAGEVVLINRSIDLIEQETMRPGDLPDWTHAYVDHTEVN